MRKILASVFSADCLKLGEDIARISAAGADGLHIDIMDGEFVPLFGFNNVWLQQIGAGSSLPFDLHIMSRAAVKILNRLDLSRVKSVSIHVESGSHPRLRKALLFLRERGISCGLAISPDTGIERLKPYLDEIDTVLVMSCQPGVQSAEFSEDTYERIRKIKKMLIKHPNIDISVDGGLDLDRAGGCMACGADNTVIGRYLFQHPDPREVVRELHEWN